MPNLDATVRLTKVLSVRYLRSFGRSDVDQTESFIDRSQKITNRFPSDSILTWSVASHPPILSIPRQPSGERRPQYSNGS